MLVLGKGNHLRIHAVLSSEGDQGTGRLYSAHNLPVLNIMCLTFTLGLLWHFDIQASLFRLTAVMSSRNVSYLRYCGSFLFLGVTGAVRDVLAKVEIVEVSESLADVTETALCNVREVDISVAATILFPPRYWDLHQYARSLSGLFVFTSCACKDALTYIYIFTSPLSRGSNGQSMLYNVLQAVVERVQDSYRFCRNLGWRFKFSTSEATILKCIWEKFRSSTSKLLVTEGCCY